MKKLILQIVFGALLVSPNLTARTKLSLNQGTMKAGGRIQMPITVPKEGDTTVGINISPTFDYFVAHSFSLGLSGSAFRLSITGDNIPWYFNVGVNGIYHFDLGGVLYPYVGAGGGMSWGTKVHNVNAYRTAFVVTVPAGLLVALNSHVALNLGVPIEFSFTSDGYQKMELPVGYLGIEAFF